MVGAADHADVVGAVVLLGKPVVAEPGALGGLDVGEPGPGGPGLGPVDIALVAADVHSGQRARRPAALLAAVAFHAVTRPRAVGVLGVEQRRAARLAAWLVGVGGAAEQGHRGDQRGQQRRRPTWTARNVAGSASPVVAVDGTAEFAEHCTRLLTNMGIVVEWARAVRVSDRVVPRILAFGG